MVGVVQTLNLLRRTDGLFALFGELDDGDEREYLRFIDPALNVYPGLCAAWDRLSSVRELNAQVLSDVACVLRETMLDPLGDRPVLPSLEVAPPPAPHIPTAANPRAYRGTKDRPPKPRRPELMDLRPFLCDWAAQDRLLRMLGEETGEEAPDLSDERELPPLLARSFGIALRRDQDAGLADLLSLWWQLELTDRRKLRVVIAMIAAAASIDRAVQWGRFIAGFHREDHEDIAVTVIEHADREMPSELSAEFASVFAECERDLRIDGLVTLLDRDSWAAPLLADARAEVALIQDYYPAREFDGNVGTAVEVEPVRAFVEGMRARAKDGDADLLKSCVFDLWKICSAHPRLIDVLELGVWRGIEVRIVTFVIGSLEYYLSGNRTHATVARLLKDLPGFLGAIGSVPGPKQELAEELWSDAMYCGHDYPIFIEELLPKLCQPTAAADGWSYYAAERLGLLEPEPCLELVRADDRAWREFEAATRRKNDAYLISPGLDSICRHLPELWLRSFQSHTKMCLRVTKEMGAFSWPVRKELLRTLKASPVWVDPSALEWRDLVEIVVKHGPRTGSRSLPRQLRRHATGEVELTVEQRNRHIARVVADWPALLLEVLHDLCFERARLGGDGDAMSMEFRHAVMMAVWVEDNRRGLRKLLRAIDDGDDDYVWKHPASQSWLRSHPLVDSEKWREGVRHVAQTKAHGEIELFFEQRPLEALRLGTLVGSCLGLGGGFSYSAVAVVLDVNKQVVFARNKKGGFVARQIVAIQSDQKLAYYEVYPQLDDDVLRAFRAFDAALSDALSLEVASDEQENEGKDGDGGEVETVLAERWYDDGIWELDDEGSGG